MTINTQPPRALAALKLPRKIADLINIAQVIVKAMTGSPNFPNPQPTAAVMTAAVDDPGTRCASSWAFTRSWAPPRAP